ncbi:hypothetical protein ACSBR2_000218 [Camellia fascicularis]
MVAVWLGSETVGSILCSSSYNSVVGIKTAPTARTVSHAVYVLDIIVGFNHRDFEATGWAANFIPRGGYKQFLKADGLKDKRLGIVKNPIFNSLTVCLVRRFGEGFGKEKGKGVRNYVKCRHIFFTFHLPFPFLFPNPSSNPSTKHNINDSVQVQAFQQHLDVMRERGAILVDNLDIANMDVIMNLNASGEAIAILAEFKFSINTCLKELVTSPMRSLADVIASNQKILQSEATNGIEKAEKRALLNLERLSKHGFEKMMIENDLDGLVAPSNWEVAHILVIGWIFRNHCSGWISHKWNQGFGA